MHGVRCFQSVVKWLRYLAVQVRVNVLCADLLRAELKPKCRGVSVRQKLLDARRKRLVFLLSLSSLKLLFEPLGDQGKQKCAVLFSAALLEL